MTNETKEIKPEIKLANHQAFKQPKYRGAVEVLLPLAFNYLAQVTFTHYDREGVVLENTLYFDANGDAINLKHLLPYKRNELEIDAKIQTEKYMMDFYNEIEEELSSDEFKQAQQDEDERENQLTNRLINPSKLD